MSGFEAAGIVLGSLPLVISSLEHYRDGLRTIQRWRKYERELQSLVRNLETERAKLQNVCEKLLVGLVPPSRIEAMVNNPMGDLWQESNTQKKIRARLWRSWAVFEDTTRSMQSAIEELMEKLRVPVRSETNLPWVDTSSIAKEVKRAGFALNRSQYAELLSTIRDGVSNLESLITTNIELEPQRRVRSRIRLLSILHSLSVSIYRAIMSNFRCTCKHGVGMRLATWPAAVTPDDMEEDIVCDMKFHLALSCEESTKEAPGLWEHVSAAPLPPPAPVLPPTPEPLAPVVANTATRTRSLKRKPKSVGWAANALFQSNAATASSATSSVSVTAAASVSTTIAHFSSLNLCVRAKESQKPREGQHYGTIVDSLATRPRYFAVHPVYRQLSVSSERDVCSGGSRFVSLREILTRQNRMQHMTYRDRLQLAVYVASSVLQLYETPWLPRTPSCKDIFFPVWNDSPYYDQAFVVAGSNPTLSATPFLIRNPTLLALGILLIEILRGQTIDALRSPDEKSASASRDGIAGMLLDYMTAQRLLSDVYQASSNYGSAVRRCINGEFSGQTLDLDDEDFRQEVYSGVVALLEEDLSHA
ncbi:hypothetical protein B0T14DRAFT_559256 [Immersiella caudata]|uniref:DUF7580 domain-containing protein n=1 Tax=Immersiella caudata TaxID=314043 RepID=A0AA40CBP0_9PEZI|nr:hypothetical protein B0T14DRAFT_559256 [Immersiella caudata]